MQTETIKAAIFRHRNRSAAAASAFAFIANMNGTLYGTNYCDEFHDGEHTHIFTVYFSE